MSSGPNLCPMSSDELRWVTMLTSESRQRLGMACFSVLISLENWSLRRAATVLTS